jgi:hypothetical protein
MRAVPDEAGASKHPLYEAHLRWARETIELDRDAAQGIARSLGEDLPAEPNESVPAVLSSLRDALLEELSR